MVQVAADAAHVRDGTSGLIPKDWLGVLPNHARRDEVRTFTAIGGYYETIGVFGYLDELHALVKLGAFSNLDRMLLWISASAMKTS